ncbi:PDDEXK family nuclease [Belnapia rosea]|uniref:hypothetical protein n=1 Tax=Belnapia rosea TaxID=938405 RepID=UPI00088E2349|nr:hypothetical protein [Belnapia rosea]SDB20367.1 hypothetical protein SAMN02927895_00801 [Belnapia rosea]
MKRLTQQDGQLVLPLDADPKTAAFVAQACARHGERYGYEETQFVNTRGEVRIRCPRHGVFTQNAGKHLRGSGCRRCGGERRGAEQSRAAGDAFAAKARAKHGDRYGYEDVVYKDARTEVTIRCPKHGPFLQEGRVHLAGSGCSECGTEAMAASRLAAAAAGYVERAKQVHGDRYGYEDTVFTAAREKVTIRCPVHGPFRQFPHAHLDGQGCRRCGSAAWAEKRRRDQADFIAEAVRVHGHLFDYSLVDYRRRSGKVAILCALHGPFAQGAGHHLQGHGCPDCGTIKQADAKRHNRDEFITLARAVHGDRYVYDEVEYRDSVSKVTITCPEHGPFPQVANSHLRGNGCCRCASARIAALWRKDTPTFVREARALHGDTYEYGLTAYRVNNEKVVIECRLHGPFEMTPSNHLNGQGCQECGIERIWQARQKTQERFLHDAHRVHGGRYDYSRVAYEHSHVDVTIVCREHSPFDQTPSSHLQGSGCPRCNHFVSKLETAWLDSLGVPERSVPLGTRLRTIAVDGYDPETRTAYLFNGDYWHGNPETFPSEKVHPVKKKTYGELYRVTLMEEQLLRAAGYTVISIWERDFKRKAAV